MSVTYLKGERVWWRKSGFLSLSSTDGMCRCRISSSFWEASSQVSFNHRAEHLCCCDRMFLVLWLRNDKMFSGPLGRNLNFFLKIVGSYWRCLGKQATCWKKYFRKMHRAVMYKWGIIIFNHWLIMKNKWNDISEYEDAGSPFFYPLFCFLWVLVPRGHNIPLSSILVC